MKTIVKTAAYPTLFESLLGKEWNETFAPSIFGTHSVPAVNIIESEGGFRIELAAPGLQKDAFKLNLDQQLLTISAQHETQGEDMSEKFSRKEFSFASFKRSFTLPQSVDSEQIEANYVDGILKVALPKKEEAKAKAARQIAVA